MRILLIHNTYKNRGGEDAVFEAEKTLLSQIFDVDTLIFNNDDLAGKSVISLFVNSVYNSKSAKLMKKKIRQFRPDIIHIHNVFYQASPSIIQTAYRQKIPVVMTLHNFRLICANALLLRNKQVCEICVHQKFPFAGVKYKCFQNSYLKSLQLTLITAIHKYWQTWNKKVHAYLVFSPFLKKRFLDSSLGLNETAIRIKPNFVEDFGAGQKEDRESFYLFIGRLSKEKGIDYLLEAFQENDKRLEIIGTGDLQDLVEKASEKNQNIVYHGFRDKDFIIEKLKKCKALIFPSIWYEGMPITLLESFSTGTPVLTANQKNIKDYIENGKNGLHFQFGSKESLNNSLNEFEKQDTSSFYRGARSTYEKLYSPKRNLEYLEKIYSTIIAEA